MHPSQLLFVPGALGSAAFWRPAGEAIRTPVARIYFGWDGQVSDGPDSAGQGIDALAAAVVARLDAPTAIVAQSMGGILAVRAASMRPAMVTHLVLVATSGGIDVSALGAQDWRPDFIKAHPGAPRWFLEERGDDSGLLPDIRIPVLLIWGDADPISPVAVGERLRSLFPHAQLEVLPGGGHDLALTHASRVAELIRAHIG